MLVTVWGSSSFFCRIIFAAGTLTNYHLLANLVPYYKERFL